MTKAEKIVTLEIAKAIVNKYRMRSSKSVRVDITVNDNLQKFNFVRFQKDLGACLDNLGFDGDRVVVGFRPAEESKYNPVDVELVKGYNYGSKK